MANVQSFTFNPFQENTYVVYDETGECIIVDPGMYEPHEQKLLVDFIERKNLNVVRLVNTHCHIDHIFGNGFVKETYDVPFYAHQLEIENITRAVQYAGMFGVQMNESPKPDYFFDEPETVAFGNTILKLLFTPGHSAGSLSMYCEEDGFVLSGDALFMGSIGRTDLPGGDYDTLIASIENKLLTLPDEVIVYSGHGPETTIGRERSSNPFLV